MDAIIKRILDFKKEDIARCERHLMVAAGTPGPHLVRGKNIYAWDIDGKKYIDCTSQSWALHLGHCHPEISEIVKEQLEYAHHFHSGFFTVPRYLLAEKLAGIFPQKLSRVLFTLGGAASIEAALKCAILNRPNAHNFIALYGAYHGTSMMTTGASHTGTKASGTFGGGARLAHFAQNFIRVPPPYYYRPYFQVTNPGDRDEIDGRCLDMLEKQIRYGSVGPVCAMVMEPLQASGGQLIFSKEYLQGVKRICHEHGIVLVWDCIQTAFGRLGAWSAAELYGITPDIMVVGKSMGSGFPINAILISDELEGFKMDWIDGHTFGNNPISQVAAMKQIEIIERDRILENVTAVGDYLKGKLLEVQKRHPVIGDVRAIGFHIGLEFVKDPATREPDKETCQAMRLTGQKNGVLFGVGGMAKNVLKIKPPLITTREQADEILERFVSTLAEVENSRGA